MPTCFQYAHARTGPDHLPVLADDARADGHKRPDIVIERIHLRHGSRLQAIDVWQRDRRGWIERCPRRLNRHDEARLLPKARHHRYFVTMDHRHADAAGLRAAGERHLAWAKRQGEARRFGDGQCAATCGRRYA